MQFSLWYTGKCVVLASLKTGTQYMRWAFSRAKNNKEWYGSTVRLDLVRLPDRYRITDIKPDVKPGRNLKTP